jgi:hypothetical protein
MRGWYATNETWLSQVERLMQWAGFRPRQMEIAAVHENWPELLRRFRCDRFAAFHFTGAPVLEEGLPDPSIRWVQILVKIDCG